MINDMHRSAGQTVDAFLLKRMRLAIRESATSLLIWFRSFICKPVEAAPGRRKLDNSMEQRQGYAVEAIPCSRPISSNRGKLTLKCEVERYRAGTIHL
ncbi:hypothetical protein KIN20_009940 [Parelaphostrongylus tenuis]|uniref:Uncharacterized protein n=1 Tax=Parelaphostrongylus tenuis TaxID=148309 RepID=A0AAD5QKZ8_PARTN|nr:hypothetical protein KIN20_009940 [Parelaphostrongylus tenuis]